MKGSVDFIEGAASKTGLGVATATAASSSPIDFLASGAGATVVNPTTGATEKVADLKGALLKELQAEQKTKREELDKKALGRLQNIFDGYKAQLAGLTGKESTPEYQALQRQIAALEASFSQAPPTEEEIDRSLASLEALAARCGISTAPPAPAPASAIPAPTTASPPGLADWVAGVNYCHANQQIADALGIALTALQAIEAPKSASRLPTWRNSLARRWTKWPRSSTAWTPRRSPHRPRPPLRHPPRRWMAGKQVRGIAPLPRRSPMLSESR